MAKKQNIKTIIKKKIEITKTGGKVLIGKTHVDNYKEKKIRKEPPKLNNMNDRLSQRSAIQKKEKYVESGNQSRIEERAFKKKYDIITSNYKKREFVDYDIMICIPSYNRYDKLIRLLESFYNQETKYSFKIIILNDGSTDHRYKRIKELYNNVEYTENQTPNGKLYHWYCYNQLWEHLKNVECHAVLQMDDDFILCDNFLNKIVDIFFEKRFENDKIIGIAPHLWSFKKISTYENWWSRTDFVDGIALIDVDVIKRMNYEMKPVDKIVQKIGVPVRAWPQISDTIKLNNWIIYRTENSLVFHDGNEDSKLHSDVRKNGKGGVHTQKYIGEIL